jgi:uncharacterized protein
MRNFKPMVEAVDRWKNSQVTVSQRLPGEQPCSTGQSAWGFSKT